VGVRGQRQLDTRNCGNWAVTESGGLVGRMSLRTLDLEDGLAGVGYWVVSAARGRRRWLMRRSGASDQCLKTAVCVALTSLITRASGV